jgi:hypothetical protein
MTKGMAYLAGQLVFPLAEAQAFTSWKKNWTDKDAIQWTAKAGVAVAGYGYHDPGRERYSGPRHRAYLSEPFRYGRSNMRLVGISRPSMTSADPANRAGRRHIPVAHLETIITNQFLVEGGSKDQWIPAAPGIRIPGESRGRNCHRASQRALMLTGTLTKKLKSKDVNRLRPPWKVRQHSMYGMNRRVFGYRAHLRPEGGAQCAGGRYPPPLHHLALA